MLKDKVKSPLNLQRSLRRLRNAKGDKRIVFTNGCFDLLHSGHVTYLEKARGLGDLLIVAVNGDRSVRRLKGQGRPVNPIQDRMTVLAALQSVDYVTWFDDDAPLELILLLKPDVLVKGGDWPVEKIIGGKEVLSWGGKVKALRYVPGKNTTSIIDRAKRG